MAQDPNAKKNFVLDRAEIWVGNCGAKQTQSSVKEKPKDLITRVLSQIQSPLLSIGDTQSHPWLSPHSCQNFFRSRRVFHVPAHLSVQKVAELLLYLNEEQKRLKLTHSEVQVKNEDSLQSVYDKFMSQPLVAKANNNILNLSFDTNELDVSILVEEFPADVGSYVSTNYMPKNGFFNQFESAGGVKQFIAVTLASLAWWKD